MPNFQVDNKVSYADIIVGFGALGTVLMLVFGVWGDVQANSDGVADNKELIIREVARLEDDADKSSRQVIRELDTLQKNLDSTRRESAADRKSIEDKIDSLTKILLQQQQGQQ